jgi:hypothetical protein
MTYHVVRYSLFAGAREVDDSGGCEHQGRTAGNWLHPMPSSSEDSSGVPQRRQMTAEQSPQESGSLTSTTQTGQ